MSIDIKSREAEELVAEIKAATGTGTSQIVLELLRREAARLRRARDIARRGRWIDVLARRFSARVPPNPPTPDEISGYDEHGLPT